jgi:high-affinity iron transporter
MTAEGINSLSGALLGLAAAVLLGWVFFATTRNLSLKSFFQVTNVLLILFAAGLVAHGVHELNEAWIIPPIIEHVWDINHVLDEGSLAGQILKALFGYNGNPSLTEVLAYVSYLILVYLGVSRFEIKTQAVRQESHDSI